MRAPSDRSGWRDTPAGSLLVLNSMLAYLVFIVLYGVITQVRSLRVRHRSQTQAWVAMVELCCAFASPTLC